jgi:hypothetical protein
MTARFAPTMSARFAPTMTARFAPTMPRGLTATLVLACTMACTTACAPKQPERSLDELYKIQAEVERTADPYDLGTGDAPGRVNHERAGGRR